MPLSGVHRFLSSNRQCPLCTCAWICSICIVKSVNQTFQNHAHALNRLLISWWAPFLYFWGARTHELTSSQFARGSSCTSVKKWYFFSDLKMYHGCPSVARNIKKNHLKWSFLVCNVYIFHQIKKLGLSFFFRPYPIVLCFRYNIVSFAPIW